jgi:hypothetical protein
LASRSTTRSSSPSRSSCELSNESRRREKRAAALRGDGIFAPLANGRYRRNAPLIIMAVNHKAGWIVVLHRHHGQRQFPPLKQTLATQQPVGEFCEGSTEGLEGGLRSAAAVACLEPSLHSATDDGLLRTMVWLTRSEPRLVGGGEGCHNRLT